MHSCEPISVKLPDVSTVILPLFVGNWPGHTTGMLKTVAERINQRLKVTGLSDRAASKKAGLGEDAIRNIRRAVKDKNSTRKGATTRTITKLAEALETDIAFLLGGDEAAPSDGASAIKSVPVVGFVDADSLVHRTAAPRKGERERVPGLASASIDTVAVDIRGEALGPLLNGWLLFYDDTRRKVTDDIVGTLCVVGLADGRILVKRLQKSRSRGTYHLLSQSGAPILDVEVQWAASIRAMFPR